MKRKLLLMLFALITAVSSTQSQTFDFDVFNGPDGTLPYRIMKPLNYSPTKKYPLAIFLHGAEERGTDNQIHLTAWGTGDFMRSFADSYSAIVIVPQCPKDNDTDSFWSNVISKVNGQYIIDTTFTKQEATPPLKNVMGLINEWLDSGSVDKSRVYVGGVSMGGFATYELLWRMPSGTFAGAFPICGAVDPKGSKLESFATTTPLWLFHGSNDNIVPVNTTRNTYTRLQKVDNSIIKYTEYEGLDHVIWPNVFREKSLIPWLMGYGNIEPGYYKITSAVGKSALTKSGTGLSVSDFVSSNTQQSWLVKKATSFLYKIQVGDGANSYLSVSGSNLTLSSSSILYPKNQYWRLYQISKGVYNIISEANGYCLELSSEGFKLAPRDTSNDNQNIKMAHTRMFFLGGGTSAGWNKDDAHEMQLLDDRDETFTWTGFLLANDFKLLSTRDLSWETSYNAISANRSLVMGQKEKLVTQPQDQYDFKFKPGNAGFYTLTADMANRNIRVEEKEFQNIYVVGSATPGGWNADIAEAMSPVEGRPGVFKWEGLLNKGEFKFLLNKGFWNPSVNPISTENITSGKSYPLRITSSGQDDFKFNITRPMTYEITVDTKNMSMTISGQTNISLYIIGAAVPNVGWDNTKALPVTKLSDSTYTWTGDLNADHFKFITELGTWNSIIPNISNNEPIVTEYTHSILENNDKDYRFIITEKGNYTIRVNTASRKMTVKKNPTSNPIYLVGAAVPNVGWDNTKALAMNRVSEGIYTWTGDLNANQFKFITKLGTWNSIVPNRASNECIISEYIHEISNNYIGDYRFEIPESGRYTITVNLVNHTMVAKKTPLTSSIYLIGPAVPNVGWTNSKAIKMEIVSDDTYTWSGYLNADHFKFITKLGTWHSIVPNKAADEKVILENTHQISNYYHGGDYKFIIPQPGYYMITTNVKNRTLKVSATSNLRALDSDNLNITDNYFTIIALSSSVEVKNNLGAKVEKAQLSDIKGKLVDITENKDGSFYLGKNLPAGVYVVNIQYGKGETFIQKVLVK